MFINRFAGRGLMVALALAVMTVAYSAEEAPKTAATEVVVEAAKATVGFREQALGVLQGLINTATQVGDFIKGEVPKVISELLVYNATILWAYTLLGLVGMIVCGYFGARFLIKAIKENSDGYGAACAPFFITFVPMLMTFFCHIDDALKITLAPRVWLLEYAANLVK